MQLVRDVHDRLAIVDPAGTEDVWRDDGLELVDDFLAFARDLLFRGKHCVKGTCQDGEKVMSVSLEGRYSRTGERVKTKLAWIAEHQRETHRHTGDIASEVAYRGNRRCSTMSEMKRVEVFWDKLRLTV